MGNSKAVAIVFVLILPGVCALFADSSPYTGTAADFRSAFITANDPVIHAEATHTGNADTRAVRGWSVPKPFFGVGLEGQGGYAGVFGYAVISGTGSRIGVEGSGTNGTGTNYGIKGSASGPSGSVNYGVYGSAGGESGSTSYGVYGTTSIVDGAVAVYANGDLQYTGDLIGPVSDLRLKENIRNVETSLARIMDLEVVSFEFARNFEFSHINTSEGPQVGFIAQQVAEVFPELVTDVVYPKVEDPLIKDLGAMGEIEQTRLLALKQNKLIPHLVRALQEQQAQIEALKAQLGPLQHRLAELEGSNSGSVALTSAH